MVMEHDGFCSKARGRISLNGFPPTRGPTRTIVLQMGPIVRDNLPHRGVSHLRLS